MQIRPTNSQQLSSGYRKVSEGGCRMPCTVRGPVGGTEFKLVCASAFSRLCSFLATQTWWSFPCQRTLASISLRAKKRRSTSRSLSALMKAFTGESVPRRCAMDRVFPIKAMCRLLLSQHACSCYHIMPRGGKFLFDFTIPNGYPHDAPKVVCKTKVRSRNSAVC